ncbi:MAG: sulfotransferase [Aphanocapsa lilacina HA4352-LM1]|jgi:hypothetical protein|nr:sulfotransferase [Aphanocapsa lilacina HA4352-LM1]
MPTAPPIVILSATCSGSSPLSAMLGQHPEAYGVPEINLLMARTVEALVLLLQGPRQFQIHGLLRAVAQLYSGEQTLNAVAMARRWLSNRYYAQTTEVLAELCARVAPLRLVDPSPVYAAEPERLLRLYEAFPEAHFVHLLRHPRAQGEAVMAIAGGALAINDGAFEFIAKKPVIDAQRTWFTFNDNIRRFLAAVPASQQTAVHWEAVASRPTATLRDLCRGLGLAWSEEIGQAMLHPERSSYAGFGPYSTHLGHDPDFLRNPYFSEQPVQHFSLEDSLTWRADGIGFYSEIQELARQMGYD